MNRAAVSRAINAFERAVADKAFQGSCPTYSDDREEQEELDRIHTAIEHNYTKARTRLERLLENA